MTLKEKLLSIKPRDNSGASSSNRFDFQKDWAICMLLELHKKEEDYLLAFEFHDDIIILDSADEPKKISFYQVKTNDTSSWTIQKLLARKKGKKGDVLNSIMGKLYLNKINYDSETDSLNIVSNAKFKAKLKDSNSHSEKLENISLELLSQTELDKVIKSVKQELGCGDIVTNIIFFKVADLSVEHHQKLTKTKLAEFFEYLFPNFHYQITPIYRAIFDEIKIKSNYENDIADFIELVEKKGISRKQFNTILVDINKAEKNPNLRNNIEHRLNSEHFSMGFIREFRSHFKEYEVRSMDKTDDLHMRITKLINSKIKLLSELDMDNTLKSILDKVYLEYENEKVIQNVYSVNYIKTLIIIGIYAAG